MRFWKRRVIFFGLVLLLSGCPLPSIAQPIYLPLVINNSAPNPTGLRNGDFESGPDGSWKESSSNGLPLIRNKTQLFGAPQGGSWAAWLGIMDNETSTLSQTILIPAGGATLSFFYRMDSFEFTCGNDLASIKIGSTLLKSYDLCIANNKILWTSEQLPIPPSFNGQQVELSFQVINDFDLVSDFFIDTISLATISGQ